jgi:lipopolysaccharide export LptBFGC system permease protein LptF
MRDLLGPTYRNLAALGVVAALLGTAYFVGSHPLVRYAAWLVVFAIWMAWFVVVAREWISRADF